MKIKIVLKNVGDEWEAPNMIIGGEVLYIDVNISLIFYIDYLEFGYSLQSYKEW